jgi:hypothetical protein
MQIEEKPNTRQDRGLSLKICPGLVPKLELSRLEEFYVVTAFNGKNVLRRRELPRPGPQCAAHEVDDVLRSDTPRNRYELT